MCREDSNASPSTPAEIPKTFHDRHRLRKARALLLGILLALAVCFVPAGLGFVLDRADAARETARGAAAPGQALPNACKKAQELTDKEKPADALALIDKIRGPVPQQAQTVSTACEEQRLNAILKAQEMAEKPQPPETNPAKQAANDWDRFMKTLATPLSGAGLALLGLVVFFLVIGRLLAFVPKMPFFKITSALRAVLLFSGLALILGGSYWIVSVLAALKADSFNAGAFWALAGVCLVPLAGALCLGIYLSSRLRISLEVRGDDEKPSKADASYVAALLDELGAAPPRGIEVPQGTDVSALGDSALTVALSNKVLAAAQKILTSIFGVTPWNVVVSPANENSITVAMTRNSWAVGAATIDRTALGLQGKPAEGAAPAGKGAQAKPASGAVSELHKMAAAFVLVTLASKHHGFEGLCGATDWRSLGLHDIATTEEWAARDTGRTLLGKAIDLDPENMLAEIALQNRVFRRAANSESFKEYADWLSLKAKAIRKDMDAGTKSAAGYTCLLYRIEMTFLSAVLNLPVTDEFKTLRSQARAQAHDLLISLEPGRRVPVPGPLAHGMRLHAALAYHDLFGAGSGGASDAEAEAGAKAWEKISTASTGKPLPHFVTWYNEALASLAPGTAYAAACSIARKGGLASEAEVRRKLKYAFTLPGLKVWARQDPELKDLRSSPGFLRFLGVTVREDFWKLEAFAPYEKQLREAGILRPGDLLEPAVGPHDIRVSLQLGPYEFGRLVRLASLVRRAELVPYRGESWRVYPFRVEVVGALLQAGIESPGEINDRWIAEGTTAAGPGNPRDFIEELTGIIRQRIMVAPEAGPLKAWLRELKETPAGPPAGSSVQPNKVGTA
jgi:hypothetical protein